MATSLVRLADSAEEIEAALLLRKRRHVMVEAPAALASRLQAADFVQAPAALDFLIRLPFEAEHRSRNLRKSLARSVAEWQARNLQITIHDMHSFGRDRLIDEIYHPLFVRYFYNRGISPYGAHNLDAFLRIAGADVFIAVITTVDGDVVGAAMLRQVAAQGEDAGMPAASWVEGLVYALHPSIAGCRRALFLGLCQAFEAHGFSWLSLGRDLAWIEENYARVVVEKFRWADRILAHAATPAHWYGWCLERFAAEPPVLFIEQAGDDLLPRRLGREVRAFDEIERHLRRAGAARNPPGSASSAA